MDLPRAERMARELRGTQVGGWTVGPLLSLGKSALVLRANRGDTTGALKIFDPDIVARFGKEAQLTRIRRELGTAPHPHPHLVKILDGGACEVSGHLFVVMELINLPTVSSRLLEVPRDAILLMTQHVAAAAQHLETLRMVHRDIKPSNVLVNDTYSHATLMDLGVLRPIGESDITDESAPTFLGTLRYSPPEFLLREEEDTMEGWRAVTFYQLGGFLHDLIMRKQLFSDADPYPRLVDAVRRTVPAVYADDIDPSLVLLAQNCLVKSPTVRLTLVQWESFSGPPASPGWTVAELETRIRSRNERARQGTSPAPDRHALPSGRPFPVRLTAELQELIRSVTTDTRNYPRTTIKEPVQDGSRLQTTVYVSADAAFALSHEIEVRLTLDMFSADEEAIGLAAIANLGPQRDGDPPAPTNLFRGVYDQERLREVLRRLFLVALDLAQARSSGDAETGLLPLQRGFGECRG